MTKWLENYPQSAGQLIRRGTFHSQKLNLDSTLTFKELNILLWIICMDTLVKIFGCVE